MHSLIQTYGKQLTEALIDSIKISERVDVETLRPLLIQQGIITKATKTLKSRSRLYIDDYKYETEYGKSVLKRIPKSKHVIQIENGQGRILINTTILESEIPQILEELRCD